MSCAVFAVTRMWPGKLLRRLCCDFNQFTPSLSPNCSNSNDCLQWFLGKLPSPTFPSIPCRNYNLYINSILFVGLSEAKSGDRARQAPWKNESHCMHFAWILRCRLTHGIAQICIASFHPVKGSSTTLGQLPAMVALRLPTYSLLRSASGDFWLGSLRA